MMNEIIIKSQTRNINLYVVMLLWMPWFWLNLIWKILNT